MEITVRLLAAMKGLPPRERTLELPAGSRLVDALDALGLGRDTEVVALLDAAPVWSDSPLAPGAVLELMPIVDGG